ncbi:MAG TPA: methyltransferase domain-containing protein [Kiritimatiellia bacterium]|nr:methyltransferase domain-containing protein [Kiritimatiellia bacterium]HMP00653.1 methyltransferase domain-containing protein [Kiritimatiellia bacterium]HMP91111.1 methyltransferase domain-containing protein [Kiritimatiellia bacterium]
MTRDLNPTGAPLDFRRRWPGSELMDDPACDETMLLRTVDQFESINRWVSRYRRILSKLVIDDLGRRSSREHHLIDLGAGGCDIPVWLLREASRRGLLLRVTALDGDARIVAHARRRHPNEPGLTIHHADLATMDQYGPVDYIFCNHVLHHLPDAVIPDVLQMMSRTASIRWLINDLVRSPWAYAGFQVFGRFYRRSFAFEDGKRSIRRGFTRQDFQQYAEIAGLRDAYDIIQIIPSRIVMHGKS